MVDMLGFLKKKDIAPPPVSVPLSEQVRLPQNQLEALVQQAPSVVPEAKKTDEQLRKEALATMAMMEAARVDKGNFCLTLGQGEGRAVLLVGPIEGREGVTVDQSNNRTTTYRGKYTDYVLLTANGARRISFEEDLQVEPEIISSEERRRGIEKAREEKKRFDELVAAAIKTGNVNLPGSQFQELTSENGDVNSRIDLTVTDGKLSDKRFTRSSTRYAFTNGVFDPISSIGVVQDEQFAIQAVKNSLMRVQNPLQAQITSTRQQIGVVAAVKNSIK